MADDGVEIGCRHRQPSDRLRRVAQRAGTDSARGGGDGCGIRHLTGGRLHEREDDQGGVGADSFGQLGQRRRPHVQRPAGVDEGEHDRREVAVRDQHLGALGHRRRDERRSDRRLRSDRDSVRADADEGGEVMARALDRGCVTGGIGVTQGRGIQIRDDRRATGTRRQTDGAGGEVAATSSERGLGGCEGGGRGRAWWAWIQSDGAPYPPSTAGIGCNPCRVLMMNP